MKSRLKKIAIFLILISIFTSLAVDVLRLQAERNNRTVEIAVDYDEVNTLRMMDNSSLQALAKKMKERGATGVLVRERTLKDYEESGQVVILKGSQVALQQQRNPDFLPGLEIVKENSYLFFQDEDIYQNVYQSIAQKKKNTLGFKSQDSYVISTFLTAREKEKLGVGFPLKDLKEIAQSGLNVICRIRDWELTTSSSVRVYENILRSIPNLSLVTFNDDVIPGANRLPEVAEILNEINVPVGMFEFYPQQGLTSLAVLMDKQAVRVHAISENELAKYSPAEAVQRYKLAVSERNIRVLYVRFLGMTHAQTALDRSLNHLQEVKVAMQEEGFMLGHASLLEGLPYSRLIIFLIGLGVIGGLYLLLSSWLNLSWALLLTGLALLGWVGILGLSPLWARKGFALLAVIIFPILSVITYVREEKRSLVNAAGALLKMSGVSLIGALIMTGLLADKSFMLTLDRFTGVKLAHLVPLLIVPGYFLLRKTNPCEKIKELLAKPVQMLHILAGFILVSALAIYLIRTGNEGTLLVSSWEIKLREILDQILIVRPRTKEFLIGHPLMLALLYYGYRENKLLLLFFGIIGQVSLVNTYAHIHTPLMISLIRSGHGLWLGILIGAVIIVSTNYLTKWYLRRVCGE